MCRLIKIVVLLFVILISISGKSQNVFFGVIDSYINKKMTIALQQGDNSKIIDEIKTHGNGSFSYDFSDNKRGLYRIYLENNESFDIILADEPEVEIFTRMQNSMYSMIIIESDENKQLYRFIRPNLFTSYKIDLLTQFLELYPDEKFGKKIEREIRSLQKKDRRNLNRSVRSNRNSFAGRYITYFKKPQAPRRFSEHRKREYIRENFLNYYDFSDVDMIYSDAYTNIVFDYIMMHRNNENELYAAAVNILQHIENEDPKIFNFIFDYILKGFESLEMFEICAKLSVEFGDVCSEDDENLSLRIRSYTELGIGKTAPNIIAKDISGRYFNLSEIHSDYSVLIFWASWCHHCKNVLDDLVQVISFFSENNINVIGISLDYDERELLSYLDNRSIDWTVICDYKAWDGSVVYDYAVYATPTFFLLDSNRKILQKPLNIDQLIEKLENLVRN